MTVDVPSGGGPGGLAARAGSFLLGDVSAGAVWRIQPETQAVEAKIAVDGRVRGVAFGGGFLWVATESGAMAIDPATNRVTRSIRLGDFESDTGPKGIGYLAGSVWVSVE